MTVYEKYIKANLDIIECRKDIEGMVHTLAREANPKMSEYLARKIRRKREDLIRLEKVSDECMKDIMKEEKET